MGNYVLQFWITFVSPNDTHLYVLGKSVVMACNRIFKGLNKGNQMITLYTLGKQGKEEEPF